MDQRGNADGGRRGCLLSCLMSVSERDGTVILRGGDSIPGIYVFTVDLRFVSRQGINPINTSSSSHVTSAFLSFSRCILERFRAERPCGPRTMSPPRLSTNESCCSRAERVCWVLATWVPVSIVYGATTWALYVNTYLVAINFVKGLKGITL